MAYKILSTYVGVVVHPIHTHTHQWQACICPCHKALGRQNCLRKCLSRHLRLQALELAQHRCKVFLDFHVVSFVRSAVSGFGGWLWHSLCLWFRVQLRCGFVHHSYSRLLSFLAGAGLPQLNVPFRLGLFFACLNPGPQLLHLLLIEFPARKILRLWQLLGILKLVLCTYFFSFQGDILRFHVNLLGFTCHQLSK